MQVRCPQCHTPIDLSEDSSLSEIACPSCGSSFSLIGQEETSPYEAGTKTIGHFELVEQIGTGAFGSVWRAKDVELDRVVAVKIPRKGHLSPTESEQFLREARAAAQLRHANIVSVHEVGRDEDTVYIVSDFVEGVTLADRLTAQQFSAREAAELCVKIAEALHHAHEAGVIHRDLKPGNVILDAEGAPHIMDFGLARREAGEVTMTVEGKVLGTPAYMSPEQAKGAAHQADRRSDVYSLGVVLFEMLTGERPFRGSARMLMHQVVNEEPPSPRKLNSSVPRDLETICLKCIEKEPERRYSTAKDAAADVRRFLDGKAILARPVTWVERGWRWCKRNPVVAGLATSLIVAVLTGLVGATWQWMRAERSVQAEFAERMNAQRALERETEARHQTQRLLYISDMNVARQAWEENNVGRVVELLKRHMPQPPQEDLRRFEWYHLFRLCQRSQNAVRIQSGIALDVAFSPDGTILAVANANSDRTVGLWEVATGRFLGSLGNELWPADERWNTFVEFSPDGQWIAYPSKERTAVRLRHMDGSDEDLLLRHAEEVLNVAVSRDSRFLASTSRNGTVRIWSLETLKELAALDEHTDDARAVALSPDSKLVASGSRDGTIRIWKWETAEDAICLDLNVEARSVTFSPDGKVLASGHQDGAVKLWSATTGDELAELGDHRDAVRSLAFSPKGDVLASGSRDNTIKLWKWPERTYLETLKGHSGIVQAIAFSSDGSLLASGSQDYTVMLWNMEKERQLDTIEDDRVCSGMAFLPHSEELLATLLDGRVQLWDVETGGMKEVSAESKAQIISIAISSESLLATVDDRGTIQLWRLRDGGLQLTFSEVVPVSPLTGVPMAFSSDGETLALAGMDCRVRLFGVRGNRVSQALDAHKSRVNYIAFSPDGTTLATGSRDGAVSVWQVTTGSCVRKLSEHRDSVYCVAFSPDGKILASGSFDNTIVLWDWKARDASTHTLRGHSATVHHVLFSQRGDTLFSAGGDRTIKLWDLPTLQERFTLASDSVVKSISLSKQEAVLASRGVRDGTIRLWRAATEEEVEATDW